MPKNIQTSKYISGHTGKMPYFSQGEALLAARPTRFKKERLNVYTCDKEFGPHFHLSSMRRKVFKQVRRQRPDLFA